MQERIARQRTDVLQTPSRERPRVRRRLTVGPADDRFEREADAIAAQVMANLRTAPVTDGAEGLQRRTADGPVVGADGGAVAPATEGRIRPSGDRFDDVTRRRMEGAFGADFSAVRVHTSATIDTAAEGLAADAFTLGRDVYVRRSLYRPGTPEGDSLLAHELTHTLQQGGSRIRRSTTHVGVSADMPADRVSLKKRMLYLDFVKMKRYDPKYGKAIKGALGLDDDDDDDDPGGTWGHWWTEVGTRNPLTGAFDATKSYGWWPNGGAGGISGALAGVPGILNAGRADDPHHGETGEAGLTEFHPAMNVDTDAETYDQIKKRVTGDIDTFARGYSGKWQWKLGWGQNCHTFQQSMKTRVKMHYQSAKGYLEEPGARAKATKDIKDAEDKAKADETTKNQNLAAVAGKKWYVYTQSVIGTISPDGDDGPNLPLDASKEFALTGGIRKLGFYYCQEVVTRLGGRGWVSEMELKQFSNM